MKIFEVKNGIIQKAADNPSFQDGLVIEGGYASCEGGFWALIKSIDGRGISGKIKDPEVYDSILQAYLSKELVRFKPDNPSQTTRL